MAPKASASRRIPSKAAVAMAQVMAPPEPFLNDVQQSFLNSLDAQRADALLIENGFVAIRNKINWNREEEGRTGWHTSACTNTALKEMLLELMQREDWVDVAIVAQMLLVRQQLGYTD